MTNQTILDLKPCIAEYAVELYFNGMEVQEAIQTAIKKFEGVKENANCKLVPE
jgi:hypothetical protein